MTLYLTDDTLGRLDLGPTEEQIAASECGDTGYIVTGWEIGFPAVREVVRTRALQSGTIDDTRFTGARAVTVSMVLNQNDGCVQELIDKLMPYVSPRYRPRLHWVVPSGDQQCGSIRSAVVRGVDAPVSIAGSKFNLVTAQWVMPDGVLEASDETCQTITPSEDVEAGRHYDAPEDQFGPYYTNASGNVGRQYPTSLGVGTRVVNNPGNAVTDWEATIFGPITNPVLAINGVDIAFTRGIGQALLAGQSVTINTRERTILFNNDPTASRFSVVNFPDWSWEEVRLQPGENLVRLTGSAVGAGAAADLCWRAAYL